MSGYQTLAPAVYTHTRVMWCTLSYGQMCIFKSVYLYGHLVDNDNIVCHTRTKTFGSIRSVCVSAHNRFCQSLMWLWVYERSGCHSAHVRNASVCFLPCLGGTTTRIQSWPVLCPHVPPWVVVRTSAILTGVSTRCLSLANGLWCPTPPGVTLQWCASRWRSASTNQQTHWPNLLALASTSGCGPLLVHSKHLQIDPDVG